MRRIVQFKLEEEWCVIFAFIIHRPCLVSDNEASTKLAAVNEPKNVLFIYFFSQGDCQVTV